MLEQPFVSVIVPVKDRPDATRALVQSFLNQTYPASLRELIIVGDVKDTTWEGIIDLAATARNVRIVETHVRSDGRDANAKRNVGLEHAKGDILVLTDSDIVLPPAWLETGVKLLLNGEHEIVAGGEVSDVGGNFLAEYIDRNPVGTKTPRMNPPYVLTAQNAGKGQFKQPITANLFFTRKVYEEVGGLDADFVTPYEDFPYADMMVWKGFSILCTSELDAHHAHRDNATDLAKEYWRAGIGCADYVMRYGASHLAKARTRQLVTVLVAAVAWIIMLASALLVTLIATVALVAIGSTAIAVKLRQPGAALYLSITVLLSALFSAGMVRGFIWRRMVHQRPTEILYKAELVYLP